MKFAQPMQSLLRRAAVSEITATNAETQQYGLILSEAAAMQIVEARNEALRDMGRVELSIDLIARIITTFCDSPYLNQENYAQTIGELLEAFYHMKNETRERISDDGLLGFMKKRFDGPCSGSVELLTDRELPKLILAIVQNDRKRAAVYEEV
jgi:hypothetical protein